MGRGLGWKVFHLIIFLIFNFHAPNFPQVECVSCAFQHGRYHMKLLEIAGCITHSRMWSIETQAPTTPSPGSTVLHRCLSASHTGLGRTWDRVLPVAHRMELRPVLEDKLQILCLYLGRRDVPHRNRSRFYKKAGFYVTNHPWSADGVPG